MRCARIRASRGGRRQLLFALLLWTRPALGDPLLPERGASASAPDIAPSSAVLLTWPDLVRLVDQHPRLAAGRHRVDAARGSVSSAGAAPNPTLEGTLGQGITRIDGNSHVEWGLSLTMPLSWIAQRGARIQAAEAEVVLAQAELQALRRDVLQQLRTLFWGVAFEQARVASLEALERQTEVLVRSVTRRVEGGEARPVEATRVEIERELVASELESARTLRAARGAELATWLGVPRDVPLTVVVDLDALPSTLDRATAIARARAADPTLASARASARVQESEVEAERLARVPALALKGFTGDEQDQWVYGAGLVVDLPLWNWNAGLIAQAEAEAAASRAQAEATGLAIEASVLEAQAACEASVATATRMRNAVVPRSESAASTMEKTYQLGEASLLELIDARRTLLDAHRLHLEAVARAQLDCSRLDALVGGESR